jgi:26S proteasome regulatory subunit N7
MADDEKMSTTIDTPKPDNKKKSGGQPSASEESASPYPDMEFGQDIHKLTVKAVDDAGDFQTKTFKRIAEDLENPSLYRLLQTNLQVDAGILSESDLKALDEKNASHVKELEAKEAEAKESAGDMEVMDARVEIARFAAKSLTKEEALEAYQQLLNLPKLSSGKKIDALMESSRVASFYGDSDKSTEFVERVSIYHILDYCI